MTGAAAIGGLAGSSSSEIGPDNENQPRSSIQTCAAALGDLILRSCRGSIVEESARRVDKAASDIVNDRIIVKTGLQSGWEPHPPVRQRFLHVEILTDCLLVKAIQIRIVLCAGRAAREIEK